MPTYSMAGRTWEQLRAEAQRRGQASARGADAGRAAMARLGNLDINALRELMAQFGLGGGGGSSTPYAQTAAGIAAQHQQQMEQIRLQHELGLVSQAEAERLRRETQLAAIREQERIDRERERERLLFERQRLFTEMQGRDPVRAVLLALGRSGSLLPGGTRYDSLGQLEGAGNYERQTEQALSAALGRNVDITTNERGAQVQGIGTAEQAAFAYQRGSGASRTLLSSAFGIGNEGIGGGLSTEEFVRRIEEVTPMGILER